MAKDEFITLRMDTELLNLVRELQKKYDLSQSEVIRQLLAKGVSCCADQDTEFEKLSELLQKKRKFDDADTMIKMAYRENLYFAHAKKRLSALKSDGFVSEGELNMLSLAFYEKSKDCFGEAKTYSFKRWLLQENLIRTGDVD